MAIALLLAARELLGIRVQAMLQAHPLQDLERLPLLGGGRLADDAHDEGDVLEHCEARNEAEVLKDEAHGAPVRLHLRGAHRAEIASAHRQRALGRQLFAQQQTEQRRLPAPLGPVKKTTRLCRCSGTGPVTHTRHGCRPWRDVNSQSRR